MGGESPVVRSRVSCLDSKLTLAVSLLIFLRKKDAMTLVGVW